MKLNKLSAGITATVFVLMMGSANAQQPAADPAHNHPPATSATGSQDLATQVAELQAKLAQLQSTMGQPGMSGQPAGAGMPMGMEDDAMEMGGGAAGMAPGQPAGGMSGMAAASGGGMSMMDMDMMEMGNMPAGNMPMVDMMGRMGMSRMGAGMQGAAMNSALPGFPGASHLYHIGATGFFLDHPQHITLTVEQQTELARVKEEALLEQASLQRAIDEAEQELWQLTGADAPELRAIETQVADIEAKKAEQRLKFIQAVGRAAQLLTDEQRAGLTGNQP